VLFWRQVTFPGSALPTRVSGGAKRPLWNWHQTPDAPHPLMPCIGGQAQISEVIQRATAGLCGCIPTSQAASDSLPETPTCDSYQNRNKLACCAALSGNLHALIGRKEPGRLQRALGFSTQPRCCRASLTLECASEIVSDLAVESLKTVASSAKPVQIIST
jgi:hypothetical protein